ncbi:MAG: tetratricopeptide repeat protein, partial [Myxococcota bacterium]|nr:tetratricopeptide repeat protein [Myxococcota bacterium]
SFREAQIALNLSRSEGRVRYEAPAQGYMSDRMVSLGRATEGIGVLRACIQRVRNYGDHQMAGILLIQMGEVLRRAGQLEEARETYMEAAGLDIDRPDFTGRSGSGINPPPGDTPALAHANLALMAILDADGVQALHHLAPGPGVEDHILVTIWEVLEPIAQLLQGDRPPPPPAGSVSGLIQLGIDGIFMGRVLVELYQRSGLVQAAAAMDAAVEQGCQQAGVARSMADSLMAHFESRYQEVTPA